MHLIYFRYFLQLQMRIMSSSFVTWLKSFGEKKQKGARVISLKMHPQHQPQRIRYYYSDASSFIYWRFK